MTTIDEFNFSLPRLWVGVGVICLLELALVVGLLTGFPPVGLLLAWMPRSVAIGIAQYGPFVLCALWLATVLVAVMFHGWRGLWLLLVSLIVLPITYLYWALVWNCAVNGQCL